MEKSINEQLLEQLLNMPVNDLKALYNSGMMPMPMKADGSCDFEVLRKIQKKCGIYWGYL